MAHLLPLPGTPLYDATGGLAAIVDQLRVDLDILLDAGFDAVLFCNEGDRPYSFNAGYDGVAAMTRVVTELAPKDRPFGVDYLWDSRAALAVAMATGASFIRGVMVGAYESDMGLWSTDVATLLRERRRLDADDVAMFMNITPEYSSSVGTRSVTDVASSAVVSSLADTILISGPVQGSEPDLEMLARTKTAIGERVPVLANTGAKAANVAAYLAVADGIIVGTDLKKDGYTWNAVDAGRVERFMRAAGRRPGADAAVP
jgi:membrane complex biogenesis BtpA family protein